MFGCVGLYYTLHTANINKIQFVLTIQLCTFVSIIISTWMSEVWILLCSYVCMCMYICESLLLVE